MRRAVGPITLLICLLAGLVAPAHAIIVLGGTDAAGVADGSGRNLNPAPSNLGNYVFDFGSFLGTPIAPQYFVTANHIGNGGSGGAFVYNNGTATPTAYTATLAAVQDDLAIWKLSDNQTFSLYAPLYTASNEVGNTLITIGRGTQRGTPLNNPNNQPAGWNWGVGDGLVSWGSGTINGVFNQGPQGFGGDLLTFSFTRTNDSGGNVTDPNQGIFSTGDSGGPTFVFNPADQRYELAGINALVDSVNEPPNGGVAGGTVNAALYDARGFYGGADGTTLIDGPDPVPLSSYITRISSRIGFIDSVVPEPGSATLLTIAGGLLLRRRRLQVL
ncbi:MAG TPA: PEP-CTERM sorting domain-containing protein [Tepidisphaeraceae bacterium]|nr:PEP-CTERM sorting domain-containing protein [Tepidisphaeraceae bacterium]